MRRRLLIVAVVGAGLLVAAGTASAATPAVVADAFVAATHHGRAIRLGFVLKLAAAAVLVALLVVWVVVRLRQPSRR